MAQLILIFLKTFQRRYLYKMKKNKKNKIVYVPMGADIIHSGHLNILKHAQKYGEIVIGLFTDSAIAEYKRLPLISYEQRYDIIKNIQGVSRVVSQDTWDYTKNLNKIRPDYVVHGDDWKNGIQKKIREKVIKTIKKWSGKLIEPKYSHNISTSSIKNKINDIISYPENRVSRLKRLIYSKDIVRVLESHNSLTGLIIENLSINKNKKIVEFDGMWSSSLTDSATKGKPDNSSVDFSSRITSLNEMMDVTSKPLVFDADNGGQLEHLPFLVRSLERAGTSAIIMEDKIGLKKILYLKTKRDKTDIPKIFAKKIKRICDTRQSKDFMVIARIESFIVGKGLNDALKRAEIYSKAGADAILIHSKEKTPKEIFSFAKEFRKSKNYIPLVSVPSTYSKVYEKELIKNGFKLVIYANQLLEQHILLQFAAKNILQNSRAFEIDKKIIPLKK